jgi:glycine cleavage system H protein
LNVDYCEFPDDLYYDPENDVWFQRTIDSSGKKIARMGITSILVFVAGKITGLKFRIISAVQRGQTLGTIESIRYFGSVKSPVNGNISRFNEELLFNPSRVSASPYEAWIAEYSTFDEHSMESLLYGKSAGEKLLSRIKELKVRCFKLLPDEDMYAIGSECVTTLANLNELLAQRPDAYVVHLVTDDQTADIELVRWSMQTGNELVETRREENLYHFIVRKKKSGGESPIE